MHPQHTECSLDLLCYSDLNTSRIYTFKAQSHLQGCNLNHQNRLKQQTYLWQDIKSLLYMGYNLLHLRHRNKYQLDKEYQQGIEFMKISQMVEVKK